MGGAYGPNATTMRELTANRNEALSKSSTIGPPFIWAVPTVGHVIDKEALMTYFIGMRPAGEYTQLPLAVRRGICSQQRRTAVQTVPPAAVRLARAACHFGQSLRTPVRDKLIKGR